jgi:hypothetical protein
MEQQRGHTHSFVDCRQEVAEHFRNVFSARRIMSGVIAPNLLDSYRLGAMSNQSGFSVADSIEIGSIDTDL